MSKGVNIQGCKAIYSDKNIKELRIYRSESIPQYFTIGGHHLCFRYEPNLIDFICELNRPFVFADKHELYEL